MRPGRHTVRWEAGHSGCPSIPTPRASSCSPPSAGRRPGASSSPKRGSGTPATCPCWPSARGPADEIAVSWDDVLAAAQAGDGPGTAQRRGLIGPPQSGPCGRRPVHRPGRRSRSARRPAAWGRRQQEHDGAQRRRNDMLSLLALGYGFQVRLAGQVAAAHAASRADEPGPARAGRRDRRAAGAGRRAVDRHRPRAGGRVAAPRAGLGIGRADRAGRAAAAGQPAGRAGWPGCGRAASR